MPWEENSYISTKNIIDADLILIPEQFPSTYRALLRFVDICFVNSVNSVSYRSRRCDSLMFLLLTACLSTPSSIHIKRQRGALRYRRHWQSVQVHASLKQPRVHRRYQASTGAKRRCEPCYQLWGVIGGGGGGGGGGVGGVGGGGELGRASPSCDGLFF